MNLDNLLQSWQPELPEDKLLPGRVWAQIEQRRRNPLLTSLDGAFSVLARPAPAAIALVLFLALGLFIGAQHAANVQKQNYLRSVNPLSMNHIP